MRHVAVAIVDGVTRARAGVGRRGATALADFVSLALAFPISRSLSSFALPVLLALSVAELSVVLTVGRPIIADVCGRPHSLVIMNMVRPPRAGGRARV